MGTRHLTCVVIDDEIKVAQYGQWDGYPSGQGVNVNSFIQDLDADGLAAFKAKVRALWVISQEDLQALWVECGADPDAEWVDMEVSNRFAQKYPQFSRDTGAEILDLIAEGKTDKVKVQTAFAADSLFCEWCWVLDLDRDVLECHRGFIKEPHEGGRFSGLDLCEPSHSGQYYPVKLRQERPFSELPDDDEAFCAIFNEPNEEEAEAIADTTDEK